MNVIELVTTTKGRIQELYINNLDNVKLDCIISKNFVVSVGNCNPILRRFQDPKILNEKSYRNSGISCIIRSSLPLISLVWWSYKHQNFYKSKILTNSKYSAFNALLCLNSLYWNVHKVLTIYRFSRLRMTHCYIFFDRFMMRRDR